MFDPENVERYRRGSSGMEKVSKAEIASTDPDDVYVRVSAYDQLMVFYKPVPHSPGHINCPACHATRDAILAGTKVPRTRRKTALKLVKK
jgi:hypothetical protein